MKVFAITKDKSAFRIGDNFDTKDWYLTSDELKPITDKLEKGDELKIAFEMISGKRVLKSVEVTQKVQNTPPTGDSKFRTPAEIRIDETMRSACLAISSMVGVYKDINELGDAIYGLYDKLVKKII